ncbi:hypothetical protein T07_14975 [Trichinella nelsoni]|uniref:Uncharacterized protein n=1 Tax=Trichinella nelsoni TaxID=6336 RepID=A0A0V0RSV7_9BILA|nr:hypothetical protein T07_14975 [Trichinella nelsoni]
MMMMIIIIIIIGVVGDLERKVAPARFGPLKSQWMESVEESRTTPVEGLRLEPGSAAGQFLATG